VARDQAASSALKLAATLQQLEEANAQLEESGQAALGLQEQVRCRRLVTDDVYGVMFTGWHYLCTSA
jgi:hypothetical protein